MQRRAAAIYFVFFLVVGAGAYAYIGVAEQTHQPQFELDGTTIESEGAGAIGGAQYNLSEITHTEGGGHGGGGALVSELSWTNESYRYTGAISNNSTTTIENDSYRVVVPNESGVSQFTLQAEQNVTAILRNDSAVENEPATQNGTRYVVYRENSTLRPLGEYLPEPETITFAEGETFPYEGNDATIANVTTSEVRFEWAASTENSVELQEGQNVTLANGQQYFAHFHHHESVEVIPVEQYGEFAQTNDERSTFNERLNGLWAIVIISGTAAVLMLGSAYLPVRG